MRAKEKLRGMQRSRGAAGPEHEPLLDGALVAQVLVTYPDMPDSTPLFCVGDLCFSQRGCDCLEVQVTLFRPDPGVHPTLGITRIP